MSEPLVNTIAFVTCYWVTVGTDHQYNIVQGIRSGVWGVEREFERRIESVEIGDVFLFYGHSFGFCACHVLTHPTDVDNTPIWDDRSYPFRVKISPPLALNKDKRIADIWGMLRDKEGKRFRTLAAASRAISSAGGTVRKLRKKESTELFQALGYIVTDSIVINA